VGGALDGGDLFLEGMSGISESQREDDERAAKEQRYDL